MNVKRDTKHSDNKDNFTEQKSNIIYKHRMVFTIEM
jgi:hypothetical protein